jgi:hypothetical protein
MSNELQLSEVFTNEGVRAFGQALRFALRDENQSPDYASLVELEYVETKEDFVEVLKKFLRRYKSQTNRRERQGQKSFVPNQTHLETLVKEVDKVGVRLVRAALIAHALVGSSRKETQSSSKGEN